MTQVTFTREVNVEPKLSNNTHGGFPRDRAWSAVFVAALLESGFLNALSLPNMTTGFLPTLLLVGGMPRSGTTMLSAFIMDRFGIPISAETHFFDLAFVHNDISFDALPKEITRDRILQSAYGKVAGLPKTVDTFRQLLSEILGNHPIVGEKTPAHLMYFDYVLDSDPDVICIVILRDFFEITQSLKHVPWNHGHFLRNLCRCAGYYRQTRRLQQGHPKRLIVVNYRDLCISPDSIFRALAELLPSGNSPIARELFDERLEPWKISKRREPEVRLRPAKSLRQVVYKVIAGAAETACRTIWPVKFAGQNKCTRDFTE